VAGLQAIATARRLGAVVSSYDVRPAVKEEVQSLGATFIELPLEAQVGEGGYAREQSEEFLRKQRELIGEHIAKSDVVITTAAVPGRRAPLLVTGDMVRGMRPGSVIVDLAAESGGNVELTKPGEEIDGNGVTFVGIEVISKVPTILHTPLMSGTNAIHGIILVGAIFIAAGANSPLTIALGLVAVILATTNVVGGFVVTDRMLEMFKGRQAPSKP